MPDPFPSIFSRPTPFITTTFLRGSVCSETHRQLQGLYKTPLTYLLFAHRSLFSPLDAVPTHLAQTFGAVLPLLRGDLHSSSPTIGYSDSHFGTDALAQQCIRLIYMDTIDLEVP